MHERLSVHAIDVCTWHAHASTCASASTHAVRSPSFLTVCCCTVLVTAATAAATASMGVAVANERRGAGVGDGDG